MMGPDMIDRVKILGKEETKKQLPKLIGDDYAKGVLEGGSEKERLFEKELHRFLDISVAAQHHKRKLVSSRW